VRTEPERRARSGCGSSGGSGGGGGGRSAQTHVTLDDTVSEGVMDGETLQLIETDVLTDVLGVSVLLTVVEGEKDGLTLVDAV